VDVLLRGQPGPEVQELADAGVLGEEPHGPAEERPVGPRGARRGRVRRDHLFGGRLVASNLVSGLVEAYSSSVPVLAIVSDIPRQWEHRRLGSASQAFEQRRFLEGCVRWYGRVETPDNLPEILRSCIRIATSGRQGPVVLEIPDDVFAGEAARALGATAERVSTLEQFEAAFKTALFDEADRPWVIEASTCDIETPVLPSPTGAPVKGGY
jgi:thiamine pyrophosphate-dependent acetolactate synthase large subunit-like protein